MSRFLNALWLTPALLGAAAFAASAQSIDTVNVRTSASGAAVEAPAAAAPAAAPDKAETIEKVITYGENTGKTRIGQVTSVSQLSDVKPSDWAFQALQSLVERYGCIVGYPDKKFRGNQALTRYEFAAGLNACMDRVNELIAASTADLVKKEDLEAVKRLQEEFKQELEELRGKIDSLEVRTAKLERQQFSTTAKLNAEVIFGLAGVLGDDRAINSDQQRTLNVATNRNSALNAIFGDSSDRGVRDNTIFGTRSRLAFDASFSGKDQLRVQIQGRNIGTFAGNSQTGVTGTNMTRLGFDGLSGTGNQVELRQAQYRFPVGDLTTVTVGGGTNDGIRFFDVIPTFNPISSSGSGAVSRFGRFNPAYRVGAGTGIVLNHRLGKEFSFLNKFTLSLGYLVPSPDAQDPGLDRGLFNGSYSALAQLAFQATPNIGVGFTYSNSYYNNGLGLTGSTGSLFANNPFASSGTLSNATNVPTEANTFGLQASIRLSPGFIISGWGGYTRAEAQRTITTVVRAGDKADIWNWAVTFAFPDLFKAGNLAGVVFGMPPKVTDSDYGARNAAGVYTANTPRRIDRDSSYHIEGFYRFRLSDNIAITPGMIVILNPEGNSDNSAIYVGTIRTTFTF